jgi:hypothetical protein
MPTLTVTAADRGRTLANAGTLTAVRFMTPPTEYRGLFQLVDRYMPEWAPASPPPKQICAIDVSTNSIPAASSGTSYSRELVNKPVPFTELVLAQIPNGASFDIDIA